MKIFYTYREGLGYRWDEEKTIKEEEITKLIQKCSKPTYIGEMQIFKNYIIDGEVFSKIIYKY